VLKDLLHEAMTSIIWGYVIKGPNLHNSSSSQKKPYDIASSYLQNRPYGEATLKKTNKFNNL
jgi:hypothetical protein